ncbi:hypothetical protein EW145_g241 [Phellinidium pouzarii]|uniref:Thioredoxin domain-containing protein n=1 Tax=Phellinidium pouzarii TaxID=167371 RepID=A0A4S4LJR3_9AGAM|nr:hypothetical protein EW145_g241 [Phellinidium pouzarii]
MMMLPKLFALSLVLAPNLVSAALFPEDSLVKMIDHKGFKAALKENMTSVFAFVAPWCGHCQRMAPEYSKAALGLHPLVPMYAVDCDAAQNKRLCADQGVKGFPTVKLFPRGRSMPPVEFEGSERTASAFFYFAKRGIPSKIQKIHQFEDFEREINDKNVCLCLNHHAFGRNINARALHFQIIHKPRTVLMNKSNKLPLLWSALGNKYRDQIEFRTHRDRKGRNSVKLGFEAGQDGIPKILVYPAGETKPVQFMGIMKFDSLSKFFDELLDGSADLSELNAVAAAEDFVPDPKELEIERQQEAEMLRLAHGGFSNMIDFEAAVRDGSAQNYHQANGYPGMMGGAPEKEEKKKGTTKSKKIRMPVTDEAGQIVMDVTAGGATATATESSEPSAESVPEPAPNAEPEVESVVAEPEVVEAVAESEVISEPEVVAEPEPVLAEEEKIEPAVESERVKDEL